MLVPKDDSKGSLPSTRLSLIFLARNPKDPRWEKAWTRFYLDFWPGAFSYYRRRCVPREEARDLVQDFFMANLDGALLSRFDPKRGRFRPWFCTQLRDHQSASKGRRDRSVKAKFRLSEEVLDGLEDTLADQKGLTPAAAHKREWALKIVERALDGLAKRRKEGSIGRRVLEWLCKADRERGDAEKFAETLGISRNTLDQKVYRLRGDIRQAVTDQVRRWDPRAAAYGDEVNEVFRCLAPKRRRARKPTKEEEISRVMSRGGDVGPRE